MIVIHKQIVFAITAVLVVSASSRLCAQQSRTSNHPPPEQQASSPLQKLGKFRDNLTEKMRQSAGHGRIDTESDQRLRRESATISPQQSFPRRGEPSRESDGGGRISNPPHGHQAAPIAVDEFQDSRPRHAGDQASTIRQARFQQQVPESNSLRDRQPELRSVNESPPHDFPSRGPQPQGNWPPESDQGYPSLGPGNGRSFGSSSNYSAGAIDNFGGGLAPEHSGDYPSLSGQPYDPRFQHFSSRMPASERLRQLEQEMAEVLQENRVLQSNNTTLQTELNENRELMSAVNQSIDQAVNQLKSAEQANKSLRDQLTLVVREKQQQQEESSRLLDDIRQQLNELLAKEISDAGK